MILIGFTKPYILKFDNQVDLLNTWLNGIILITIITIGGFVSDLKI